MELIDLRTELSADIKNAFAAFTQQLSLFNNSELNMQPSFGGWTAGQVADHIIKATKGLPDEQTAIAERAFDQHVENLKRLFLDFSTKMNAPEFVHPAEGPFDSKSQLVEFNANLNEHLEAIESKDLEELCLGFEVPFTGYLTRYEWLQFFIVHVLRHTNQLKNIYMDVHK